PTKITRIVKSITARKVFEQRPEVKEQLWGGEFWADGYYINTVSKHGCEETISKYVKTQGLEKEYTMLHKQELQLELF
ncbi:MAG: transposase, partial [Candidatus Omnitrophica bacterium]|nr:transposase [Candidatus Omnitrophota bacterium]